MDLKVAWKNAFRPSLNELQQIKACTYPIN